jgi:hypothetical protein
MEADMSLLCEHLSKAEEAPMQPANRDNLGYVPVDLILLESHDGGRTWDGPHTIRLPDGDILALFWCVEDCIHNIRWVRIRI